MLLLLLYEINAMRTIRFSFLDYVRSLQTTNLLPSDFSYNNTQYFGYLIIVTEITNIELLWPEKGHDREYNSLFEMFSQRSNKPLHMMCFTSSNYYLLHTINWS